MPSGGKGIKKNRFVDMGKKETRHRVGVGEMKGLAVRLHLYQRVTSLGPGRGPGLQRPPEVAHCICLCGCVHTFFWVKDS